MEYEEIKGGISEGKKWYSRRLSVLKSDKCLVKVK